MTQDVQEELGERRMLIEKSARSLNTAREIFARGDYDFAASRAYYAAFYVMLAVLSTQGVKTSSHNGTASEFGRYFLKTKIFLGRIVLDGFGGLLGYVRFGLVGLGERRHSAAHGSSGLGSRYWTSA